MTLKMKETMTMMMTMTTMMMMMKMMLRTMKKRKEKKAKKMMTKKRIVETIFEIIITTIIIKHLANLLPQDQKQTKMQVMIIISKETTTSMKLTKMKIVLEATSIEVVEVVVTVVA